MHDLLSFSAMLLAGIFGSLIVDPLRNAARDVAARSRAGSRHR